MDSFSAIFVSVFTICIGLWLWKRYRTFQHFKSLGVPGPPPNFWTGNMGDVISKGLDGAFHDWGKTYGSFYGVYFGVIPTLVTTDFQLVKRVTALEFRNFVNRSLVVPEVSNTGSDVLVEAMSLKTGRAWKEGRKILSHIFSPAKLKKMTQVTEPVIDHFLKKDFEKSTKDLHPALKSVSLEMMGRAIMGLEGAGVGPLERGLKDATDQFFFSTPLVVLLSFPGTAKLLSLLTRLDECWRRYTGRMTNSDLLEVAQHVIDQRRANPQVAGLKMDLIQVMLDSQQAEKSDETITLTDSEIVANIIDFMFGGYDTMGIALTTIIFHLAKDPKCQDLCRQEALQCQDLNSYDELAKLPLLEGAIRESLRLYSSGGIIFNRVAEVAFTHQQWNIPKGSTVVIPSCEIHRDPEIWEDPDVFKPERHLLNKEEFLGFGFGPRNCLASRLVPMLLKQVLGRILVSFDFRLPPGAAKNLSMEYGVFSARINNTIQIEVTPRK